MYNNMYDDNQTMDMSPRLWTCICRLLCWSLISEVLLYIHCPLINSRSEFTVRMTKLIDKFRSARSYYVSVLACLSRHHNNFMLVSVYIGILCSYQTEPHLRSEVEGCTTDIQEARQRGIYMYANPLCGKCER